MASEEIMFRPPFEANSLLLPVTHGCSHNACAFCTMYKGIAYSEVPLEKIAYDLRLASVYRPRTTRVFLENGDAFTLSGERLAQICEMIRDALPAVKTITMYASINNVATKTDDELARLAELGVDELNIGVESGLDDALMRMRKGYTAEQAIDQLMRLKAAGISYGLNIILGLAGPERRFEHAEATARLLNATQPYLVFTGTTHADAGCELYEWMESGEFVESVIAEYLDEEEALIDALALQDTRLFSLHPSNIVRFDAMLPRDKAEVLAYLRQRRSQMSPAYLDSRPVRFGEGGIMPE